MHGQVRAVGRAAAVADRGRFRVCPVASPQPRDETTECLPAPCAETGKIHGLGVCYLVRRLSQWLVLQREKLHHFAMSFQ
jgi:hypothetical protein